MYIHIIYIYIYTYTYIYIHIYICIIVIETITRNEANLVTYTGSHLFVPLRMLVIQNVPHPDQNSAK